MEPTRNMLNNLYRALRISPDNAPLLLHVANVEFEMGFYADALENYKRSLRLSASCAFSKLGLANCFYELGKIKNAFVVTEELEQDRIDLPELSLLLAKLFFIGEDMDKANHYMAKACEGGLVDEQLAHKIHNFGIEAASKEEKELPSDEDLDNFIEYFEKPDVNFSKVGGLEDVKDEIRSKIIDYPKHSKWYAQFGKKAGGGILLYGPPGCGKTHIARAVAGEAETAFLNVGIHEILDMHNGKSEKNLNKIFDIARTRTPCVLFFDEVDALGASRADMKKSGSRHLINQFLSEMDGIDSDNEGLLALAATNAPWHLDPAFRRPGRFDKMMFVPPPNNQARSVILDILLNGVPNDSLDLNEIAALSEEYSGADLKKVVEIARDHCLGLSIKEGIAKPITQQDLLNAINQVRPSTREWFKTAKNYADYANDGGQYDDILKYLEGRNYFDD